MFVFVCDINTIRIAVIQFDNPSLTLVIHSIDPASSKLLVTTEIAVSSGKALPLCLIQTHVE